MTEKLYTVNDVSKIVGISTKTIKNWERKGELPEAKRNGRGWRVYEIKDIRHIKKVAQKILGIAPKNKKSRKRNKTRTR